MAAYKTNTGLGGARTSFRPPPARPLPTNPGLGGALTSFRPAPLTGSQTSAAYKQSLTDAFARLPGAQQPAAAAAVGGGAPAAPAPPPDPRDSTFNTGVAGLLFGNKNQRDDLTTQGGQATQDFNTMLSRMAENRASDLLAQNYNANKQGLFYSGQLGKRRDTVDKGYTQQQDDAQTTYDRGVDARRQALERLGTVVADPNSPTGYSATGQAGIDLTGLFGEAVGRQTAADAGGGGDRAAAGQGAGAPDPVAAAPAAAAAAAPAAQPVFKTAASAAHGGKKWIYRQGASGAWIPIRPA